VAVFASLGSVLYGYDLGVIAGAVASSNFITTFNPTKAETGAVVSVFTGGAFIGAGLAGPAGDSLGRKKTILIGALVFILGGGLQTGAQTLAYLYAGRAIAGVGVGFLVMIVPLYQAELAHPSIRGRVTALQQFMLGVGALVASWVSYATYTYIPASSSQQWRISLGIQIIPAGFLAALIMLFPESPRYVSLSAPLSFSAFILTTHCLHCTARAFLTRLPPHRWLIDHGKPALGLQTLAQLHAHGNENDAWVRAEFEQIQDMITFEQEHEAKSYIELFTNRSSFRRLLLAVSIQASVQMTGVSAIQYYSPTIFAQIGIPGSETLKYQGISSIIAIIAQFCCILFIDYTGRRWAMIGGNLVSNSHIIGALIIIIIMIEEEEEQRREENRREGVG
jgi:MFS family permease